MPRRRQKQKGLAEILANGRARLGLTKAAAAEAAGVTASYWSLIESGQRDPLEVFRAQRRLLERLAEAVGLTFDDLL